MSATFGELTGRLTIEIGGQTGGRQTVDELRETIAQAIYENEVAHMMKHSDIPESNILTWDQMADHPDREVYTTNADAVIAALGLREEPAVPAWPTAPHVWWEGEVWVRGDDGEYQTAGDYWAKSHLDSTVQPVRDGARRFVREAVPVTLVPTEAWEEWLDALPMSASNGDRDLLDAVDSLAQEVDR